MNFYSNIRKNLTCCACLIFAMSSIPDANAYAMTTWHRIAELDSLPEEGYFFIRLDGYTNASCDENRILFRAQSYGEAHYNELVAMAMAAFVAGIEVRFGINDSCEADRIILRR